MAKTTIDKMADEIMKGLNEYLDVSTDTVKSAVKKASNVRGSAKNRPKYEINASNKSVVVPEGIETANKVFELKEFTINETSEKVEDIDYGYLQELLVDTSAFDGVRGVKFGLWITSNLFLTRGIERFPEWELIKELNTPKIYAWSEIKEFPINAEITGTPPKQYIECIDGNGEIAFDDREVFIVRKMFRLASEGIRPNKISTYLNENRLFTGKGKKWSCGTVLRILRNEIYKGDVMMQKTYLDAERKRHRNEGQKDRYYIADNHKAAVSKELWDSVQEMLDDRIFEAEEGKKPRKMGGNSHNTYPLSGMLYCPHCGSMLHHRVSNEGKQIYWSCGKKIKKGSDKCIGVSIPEKIADELIVDEPSVVMVNEDELGRKAYYTIPKNEYEAKRSCPYKVRKSKNKYSHSTYPLSGKLYCSKCGTVMHSTFLGYDKGPNGEFVINEEQAKVVRKIYKWYLMGYGIRKICKMLMEEKIETPAHKTTWHWHFNPSSKQQKQMD